MGDAHEVRIFLINYAHIPTGEYNFAISFITNFRKFNEPCTRTTQIQPQLLFALFHLIITTLQTTMMLTAISKAKRVPTRDKNLSQNFCTSIVLSVLLKNQYSNLLLYYYNNQTKNKIEKWVIFLHFFYPFFFFFFF